MHTWRQSFSQDVSSNITLCTIFQTGTKQNIIVQLFKSLQLYQKYKSIQLNTWALPEYMHQEYNTETKDNWAHIKLIR